MTVPQAGFTACLTGAAAVVSGLLKVDEGYAVMLILMAMMWLYIGSLHSAVARHQKAVEWFADHVYERDKPIGARPPTDLKDIVKPD